MGKRLRLGLLYAIHARQRCPRLPDCVSYYHLGKWAPESASNRSGTAGKKRGKASRKWAFAEAAVLCLRHTAPGQQCLVQVAKKHGTGKALTL
jgi:hypothetical protein